MCDCSGAYKAAVPPDAFHAALRTFRKIADTFGVEYFPWLWETCLWIEQEA